MEDLVLRSTLSKLSSVLFLLFATTAQAYDNRYLDSFTTTNWSSQYGFQTCAGYGGARPCISDGTYFGTNTGDVVFAYSTYSISNSISTTSAMRTSSGSNYLAIDMMTGPRNNEQGNKTEYVVITVTRKNIQGNAIGMVPFTFNQSVSNTTMETYAFDIGSLANTYSIDVTISGRDGGYWAGNYGAVLGANSVYFTDTDPTVPPPPQYESSISNAQQTSVNTSRGVTHSGNGIYITQAGNNNTLTVDQEGNNNLIAGFPSSTNSISDANITGNNNTTTLRQDGENNVILFNITGDYNTTTVDQGDGGHSDDNRAEFLIGGDYNTVDIKQRHNNGIGNNGHYIAIGISGDNNNVLTNQQNDGDKIGFISITGDDNDIDLIQQGTGSHYVEIDVGSNQTVDVTQDGTGNHNASVSMTGYASGLDLTQDSSTNQTYSINQNCLTVTGCGTTTVLQQ